MPARTAMRQVREVLRLKFVGGVPTREIARRIGVAAAEVALASDSALYRGSADATPERLRLATEEAPLLIARNVAFFADNLRRNTVSDGSPYFEWDYQQGHSSVQNIPHGGFELGCLAVLLDDRNPPERAPRARRAGRSGPAQPGTLRWFREHFPAQDLAAQPQRPTCPADSAIFCRPPDHKIEHGGKVSINRIAVPAGLALLPSNPHSQKVLAQRWGGIGNVVLNRISQAGRRQPKIRIFAVREGRVGFQRLPPDPSTRPR